MRADKGGYMRIRAVICSGVGARDTCVSKNTEQSLEIQNDAKIMQQLVIHDARLPQLLTIQNTK